MNYTSIEQSKKLLRLGLTRVSADLAWIDKPSTMLPEKITDCPEHPIILDIELESILPEDILIPCWSVTALLRLIPNGVLAHIEEDGYTLWYCNTTHYGEDFFNYDGHYTDSPIDAVMEIIVWLIKNNHANNLCFKN